MCAIASSTRLQIADTWSDRRTVTRTLLLADDSVTIQRVIELTFADEDVQVVAVGDGDQAIARLEERPPDIVLADIAMPGKNGYEVASYIKQSERLAHIPVLLLTGAFEPVDQRRVAEVRCDGVLAKPFEPQFVIGRVKELLGMDRDGDAKAITTAPTVAIPRVDIGPAASDSGGTSSISLNDYLDRLDNALANLPVGGSGASAAAKAPAPVVDHRPPVENEWDISLGEGSDASQASSSVTTAVAPAVRAVPTLLARSSGPALPALAEAFAALLAAEHGASPPAPAAWPAPATAPIGDDVVNRVVERVLGQMSDRIVRETVTEIVSKVAERLVREEIERLKASIS
jgi:CheY-like chemotaxis protein